MRTLRDNTTRKPWRFDTRIVGIGAWIILSLSSPACRAQQDSVHAIREESAKAQSLTNLWESEAALAQLEAERVLFDHWDIFNSFPTDKPTSAPTPDQGDCLQGTTRDAYLLEQLSQITSESLLTNPSTPQGQAYTFMVNDPLQPNVCSYPTLNQRYALATFYFSTNGASWVNDSGWLSAVGECNWSGVTCDGSGFVTEIGLGT